MWSVKILHEQLKKKKDTALLLFQDLLPGHIYLGSVRKGKKPYMLIYFCKGVGREKAGERIIDVRIIECYLQKRSAKGLPIQLLENRIVILSPPVRKFLSTCDPGHVCGV